VMLIDIDNGNVAHPVLTEYEVTGDRFTLSKTLTILPYPGQPLKADTDYAAVIFTGVETAAGDPVEPAPLVSQLDMPWDDTHGVTEAEWAELQSQRDRVRGAVNATTTWAEADIAAFTVFHTQDTDRELDSITSTLATLPAPTLTVTSQGACAVDATVGGNGATNSLIEGTLGMPDFQKGAYPFLQSGGFMEFAVDDKAIVQRTTDVPVRLRVPCGASPAAGWPSIGHVGAIDALGDSDTFAPPYQYGGYVFAEIPAHMAGATSTTLTGVNVPVSQQPGLLYANFVNPAAGRINPLQQASNHISLRSFLDTFTVDGTTVGTTGTVGTDPAASAVSGHSQGAATLPFVAKGAPGVEGAFSSSGSGAQYHSLAHTGQRNSLALFTGEDEPLDELNPLIQLVQTTTEASDAINVEAAGLPAGLHYVNVTGQNDGCVAAEASRHFATAMGLGLVNRQFPASFYGDPVFDPATATLPAAANGPGGATRLQIEGWGDHAEASANPHLGTNFLTYIAAGVAPQVDPYTHSSTYGVCGYRYDYLGGDPFGRV